MERSSRRRVPYRAQAAYNTCGPACLGMVLAHHGLSVDEVRLAALCRIGRFGTTPASIVEAAKAVGLSARAVERDRPISDLEETVRADHDLIALVSDMTVLGEPFGNGHFVLVLDCDAETVVFHDPDAGPERRVSRGVFLASRTYHEFGGVVVWKD